MPDFSKKGKMRQKYGVCIVGAMSESPLNVSCDRNDMLSGFYTQDKCENLKNIS